MQYLEIAGLSFKYVSKFPSEMHRMLADYAVSEPDIHISTITLDPALWIDDIEDETGQGAETVEFYALSADMGEHLPLHNRLQTHGVAIAYEGKAYIFSAPSGTGKSTRAFLWQKYLGTEQVTIINGDKPVIWFQKDDVLACGSPWAGKEGLQRNICVPIGGICLLKRSSNCTIRRAEAKEFFDLFVSQVQMPKNTSSMMQTLGLMEELFARIPIFMLENDMSEQGVKVAFEALTGMNYENNKI